MPFCLCVWITSNYHSSLGLRKMSSMSLRLIFVIKVGEQVLFCFRCFWFCCHFSLLSLSLVSSRCHHLCRCYELPVLEWLQARSQSCCLVKRGQRLSWILSADSFSGQFGALLCSFFLFFFFFFSPILETGAKQDIKLCHCLGTMVSVDVKHHVYVLSTFLFENWEIGITEEYRAQWLRWASK